MENKYPKNPKKILVIRNDRIGDMANSTNVFSALKENFPNAKITAIASKANRALIEKNKKIDKIITLDFAPRTFKDIINFLKTSLKIRKEKFDIGIDLRGSYANILFLMYFGGVKYRIGFRNDTLYLPWKRYKFPLYEKYLSKILLNYSMPKERWVEHCTVRRMKLLSEGLGIKYKEYWPEIATDKEDEKELNKFMKENKLKQFISFVPDAMQDRKQWPMKKWDKYITHIEKRHQKYKILLFGGGGDRKKLDNLHKKHPNTIVCFNLNLRLVYLLFKKSKLVTLQDGGTLNIAWPSRTNVIALIPTEMPACYIKPLGKNSVTIHENIKRIPVEKIAKISDDFISSSKS